MFFYSLGFYFLSINFIKLDFVLLNYIENYLIIIIESINLFFLTGCALIIIGFFDIQSKINKKSNNLGLISAIIFLLIITHF